MFYKQDDYQGIVSIGDGIWDYKTAQNLGIDFIGIGKKIADALNGQTKVPLYPHLENILLNDNI